MSRNIIDVESLSKSYNNVNVFSNLNFSIDEGESYGLLGPNGSGKTTLINIMTGQEEPSSGSVKVDGDVVNDNKIKIKKRVGILPEKESPFSFLTPREHFHFCGKVRGISKKDVSERIEMWSEKLLFDEHLDTLSKDLSRGNQQKVMFTQAVLHEPDILFIDEPVANLDPIIQEKLKEIIVEYNNKGNTIILSTHHLEFALNVCSSAVFLMGDNTSEINIEDKSREDIIEIFKGDMNEE